MKPQPIRILHNKAFEFSNIMPLIYIRILTFYKILKKLLKKFFGKEYLVNKKININKKVLKTKNKRKFLFLSLINLLFNYSDILINYKYKKKYFFYPENGSKEIISKILQIIPKEKIIIKKGIRVISATEKGNDFVELKLSNGKILKVKKLIITSQTHIEFIQNNNGLKLFSNDRSYRQYIVLLIKNNHKKIFSYAEFLDDESFRRVSDISFTKDIKKDETLLCVEMKFKKSKKIISRKFLRFILNKLKNLNLIDHNSELVDYFCDNHIFIYKPDSFKKIKKYFSNIILMESLNFSFIKNLNENFLT